MTTITAPMTASMKRSLSTGALQSAAQLRLSHMPKRSTQHGVFLAGFEMLPATLKPGQKALERQLYTEEAKLREDTYIATDLAPQSTYQLGTALQTNVSDYINPARPIKPTQPTDGLGHHKVGHWCSTYKSSHNPDAVYGSVQHRQNGPSYQAVNPPTCVGGEAVKSTYLEDFGHYGHNPIHRVRRDLPVIPVEKTALTRGTPKGTMHMPGYQGFLPSNTSNPYVARVEGGATLRNTADKSNLTEVYHQNMPTYGGHKPLCPMNDKGPVNASLHTLTEIGRSYRSHVGKNLP